jgi:hypothetical protein
LTSESDRGTILRHPWSGPSSAPKSSTICSTRSALKRKIRTEAVQSRGRFSEEVRPGTRYSLHSEG